ncbi:hypothetical protein TNCV_4379921 [Trichonephila clavipes]|nr:hypothetical protein TNCV_4379921 [Trichonephila clavipes]
MSLEVSFKRRLVDRLMHVKFAATLNQRFSNCRRDLPSRNFGHWVVSRDLSAADSARALASDVEPSPADPGCCARAGRGHRTAGDCLCDRLQTFSCTAKVRANATTSPEEDAVSFFNRKIYWKRMSPRQYGGYVLRFVTEWVRVRILSETWLYLLRERSRSFA